MLALGIASVLLGQGDYLLSQAADRLVQTHAVPGLWLGLASGRATTVGSAGVRSLSTKVPADAADILMWASISKPISAHVIADIVASKKLSLDFRPFEQIPAFEEVARPEYKALTLEDLLLHRTNLPRDFRRQSREGVIDFPRLRVSRIRELLTQPERPNAERKEQYSNAGYVCAVAAIEHLTGQSWETLWKSLLLDRWGLKSFGLEPGTGTLPVTTAHILTGGPATQPPPVDRERVAWQPSGGYRSTMEDLLKFGLASSRVINETESTVDKGTVAILAKEGAGRAVGFPLIQLSSLRGWTHSGSLRGEVSGLWVFPEREWAVAYACNGKLSGPREDDSAPFVQDVYEALLDEMFRRYGRRSGPSNLSAVSFETVGDDNKPKPVAADDKRIRVLVRFRVTGQPISDMRLKVTAGKQVAYATYLKGIRPGVHALIASLRNPGPGSHRLQATLDHLGLINDPDRRDNQIVGGLVVP